MADDTARNHGQRDARVARMGGWLWIASTLVLLVEPIVALRWPFHYDFAQRTISDLGATTCGKVDYADGAREVCSPWHVLANSAWVLSGLLLAVGAVLVHRHVPRRAADARPGVLGVLATALLIVQGLSVVGSALLPVNEHPEAHLLVALPSLIAGNLALLLLWRSLADPVSARAAGVLGLLGVVGFAATVAWTQWGGPLGLYERVAAYAVQIFVVIAATQLIRTTLPAAHT